jgi:phosphatidylserine/phosphatidylglycerophosphate/cardiolipin synthase-like enzyme
MAFRLRHCGLIFLIALAALAGLWTAGNLLLEVQLPDRSGRHIKALKSSENLTLREVFESLPAEGGENSHIRLLDDNTAAWAERWRLLADAREHLDISYYILKRDIFGVAFLGHLLHKAREGVSINILLDAIGTKLPRQLSGNDYLDTLVNTERVTVKMYRPLFFRYLDVFLTLNPVAMAASDHDKILIADGRLGLIGGRNIAAEYFSDPKDDPEAFHDADILLEGPHIGIALKSAFDAEFESGEAHDVSRESIDVKDSGEELLLAYEAMGSWLRGESVSEKTVSAIREKDLPWLDELNELPRLKGVLRENAPEPIVGEVLLLDSRTRLLETDDPISQSLISLARYAQQEIFIQSPYLVLSGEIVSVLEEAASRGVRITVLTNSPASSDNAISQAFFLEQWPEVMARVPTLRLYVAGDTHNLHAKLGAIDNQLGLIGTYNLDPTSMAVLSELMAVIWSIPFTERLLDKPLRMISAGPPLVYEYRIVRDKSGRPERDDDGRVKVAFGHRDHLSPDQRKTVERYRKLLRAADKLPGVSPFF